VVATQAAVSRGEITKEFLVSCDGVTEWVDGVLRTGVHRCVGGFSLICGVLRPGRVELAVISNRSEVESGAEDVLGVEDEACAGLSNSLFGDEWPKVSQGKRLLRELIEDDVQDEDGFIQKAFELLSYVLRLVRLT
jgi:uncharacterized protein with NRDE domain